MVAGIDCRFPARLQREFRALAVRAYPREAFAFLLGSDDQAGAIHIEELWVPPDMLQHVTTGSVLLQPDWWGGAQSAAEESELALVGTIHSHPYGPNAYGVMRDTSPSEGDHDAALLRFGVCLILTLKRSEAGRFRARCRAYGPSIPVRLTQ